MPMMAIQKEMKQLANAKKAKLLAGFFKTGRGQYGEGDIFLGVMVPQTRSVAKKYYRSLSLNDVQKLINNPHHELRLLGLIILNLQYTKGSQEQRNAIHKFYLKNTKKINNWDLVDLSAPNIVGAWLLNRDRKILYKLARSKNLWERRIAMIATAAFIRAEKFDDTLKIADILLTDTHDLIHKAVGWMLREVGKKNVSVLIKYLKPRYKKMPRTMLRYAIEKFPENKRQRYLKK
ncbi:MAG: DNA alkylation repair protein [Patescibacteria group bacterium]|nr:DNA alkylation repair protein [Patescibacteria group bacterium]